jgi:hypothetical protein
MNQKATYEITITGKLGQLPLPDLKDAIWSRIEDQLDIDMPEDNGGGPDAPTSPDWINLLGKISPYAVVVAFVSLLLIQNKDPQNNQILQTPPATNTPAINQTTTPIVKEQEDRNNSATYSGGQTDVNISSPSGTDAVSTVIPDNNIAQKADDTITTQPAPPPLVQTNSLPVQTDSVQKKKKGVSGITDSDYRIVPQKKDSTKQ